MGALFDKGTKEKSTDGGASAYAQQAASMAQEQARQAQANNEALRKQMEDQKKADQLAKDKLIADQQSAVEKQAAERAAKDKAMADQNAAQNVTGGAIDFNKLQQGALATQQAQGMNSAADKMSNLQRIQNQQIYGSQNAFNNQQTGGKKFYS